MKIPAVKQLLRLFAGMARAATVPALLRALQLGGDLVGERLAFGTPRPVFAGGRRPLNIVGIVIGRIDGHAGAVGVAQRVEEI